MRGAGKNLTLYLCLVFAVFLNVAFWLHSHRLSLHWPTVPQPPAERTVRTGFLDDAAFAYRVWGLALQNFGSVGESQALKDYNFSHLVSWFRVMDALDPRSNFVPFLAAYYFSATQDASQLTGLIHYLEEVGARPEPGKWRWLAQAAYLARHRMHDTPEALRLAKKLGSVYRPGMPLWTRNLEAMFTADLGDRQAAYLLALETLKGAGEQMSPSEYTATITMICESILTRDEAGKSPVCQK